MDALAARHAGGADASTGLLGGFLEIGDDVLPVLFFPQAGEDHLVAGDVLARVLEPVIHRLLIPDDIGALQRVRVVESLGRTRLAAEDSMERRADLVLTRLERVARPTPGEQFFALCRVALCLGGAARQSLTGHEYASDQLPGN